MLFRNNSTPFRDDLEVSADTLRLLGIQSDTSVSSSRSRLEILRDAAKTFTGISIVKEDQNSEAA